MTKRLLKKILMTVFSLFIVITLCTCSTMLEDLRKAGTKKPNFTVTFDTCGGSIVESQTLMKGEKAQKPADPTKTGVVAPYNFKGWYNGDTEYNFSTPVTENITLKARWTATPNYFCETPTTVIGEHDYYWFGDWPQTIKEDAVVIDNSTTYERGMFTYYPGSDGEWYVKQEEYACRNNFRYSDGSPANSNGQGERYFKLEPIKWRVLHRESGNVFLLAENVLQGMAYYDDGDNRTLGDDTIYPNNYEHSRVRAFLNGLEYNKEGTTNDEWEEKGFLQTAFTTAASGKILSTIVENDARSTNPVYEGFVNNNGINDYASDTKTTDKIFLLSMNEVTNVAYSFGNTTIDSKRRRKVTDYAIASGAYRSNGDNDNDDGNGWWWLRSPCYNDSSDAYCVTDRGNADWHQDVGNSDVGIVPALKISLRRN